jgi:uroporphyrinogen decarboxylase
MLPKERVIAALEHRRPDRVPVGEIGVDYPITERALGRSTVYRAKWKEYRAWWQGRRAEIVESYKRDIVDLARVFEWDFVPAPLVPSATAPTEPPEFFDEYRWRLADGSEWAFSPESEGHAICTKYPPMTTSEIPAPAPIDESRLEVAAHIVKELGGTHFILGRPDEDGTFPYENTVGLEEFLARIVTDPEFVRRAIALHTDATVIEQNALLDVGCDAVLPGSDYCDTRGPMMSPRHFREFILPPLARLCADVHRRGRYLIKHTDGNTWRILPMMIEAGIDGWHGIQPSIGMDLGLLRETFGDRLCFFGGVDCATLVAGAPEDAAREARYAIERAGLDGGLVLVSSNTLMVGVRYDNYLAMLAAARDASGLERATAQGESLREVPT